MLTRKERELAVLALDLNMRDRHANAVNNFSARSIVPLQSVFFNLFLNVFKSQGGDVDDEKCMSMARLRHKIREETDSPSLRNPQKFSVRVPLHAKVKKTSLEVVN